jgi:hypothetical protein
MAASALPVQWALLHGHSAAQSPFCMMLRFVLTTAICFGDVLVDP